MAGGRRRGTAMVGVTRSVPATLNIRLLPWRRVSISRARRGSRTPRSASIVRRGTRDLAHPDLHLRKLRNFPSEPGGNPTALPEQALCIAADNGSTQTTEPLPAFLARPGSLALRANRRRRGSTPPRSRTASLRRSCLQILGRSVAKSPDASVLLWRPWHASSGSPTCSLVSVSRRRLSGECSAMGAFFHRFASVRASWGWLETDVDDWIEAQRQASSRRTPRSTVSQAGARQPNAKEPRK